MKICSNYSCVQFFFFFYVTTVGAFALNDVKLCKNETLDANIWTKCSVSYARTRTVPAKLGWS